MNINNSLTLGTVEQQQEAINEAKQKASLELLLRLMNSSMMLDIQCRKSTIDGKPYLWIESSSTTGFKINVTSWSFVLGILMYVEFGNVPVDFERTIQNMSEDIDSIDFLNNLMGALCRKLKFRPRHLMRNNIVHGIMKGKRGTFSISVHGSEGLFNHLAMRGCIF